jgi:hypothetical protein
MSSNFRFMHLTRVPIAHLISFLGLSFYFLPGVHLTPLPLSRRRAVAPPLVTQPRT